MSCKCVCFPVVIDQLWAGEMGDRHHMLFGYQNWGHFSLRPLWHADEGEKQPTPSINRFLRVGFYSISHASCDLLLSLTPPLVLSLSALFLLQSLSLSLCLTVFEVFPEPTATYGERKSKWLTETEREKQRGNTLHDQSGVAKGWVLQGGWWRGLRNIWQIFL